MSYTRFFPHKAYSLAPRCQKIAGNVKLSGVNQQSAVVYVVDETLNAFVGNQSTDSSGNFSFTSGYPIGDGRTYHITAEYDSGSQKYNSLSQPYVQPVEN